MKKWLSLALAMLLCVNGLSLTALAENAPPDDVTLAAGAEETEAPQERPAEAPADEPKDEQTDEPKDAPTDTPKDEPKSEPKSEPVDVPSDTPTDVPTDAPTDEPKGEPVDVPSDTPTDVPTDTPTDEPKGEPVDAPTDTPSNTPTDVPTDAPSDTPTDAPDVALLAAPLGADRAAQLATPSNLRAVRDSATAIYLQWRSVSTGDGYELQSSKTGDFASPVTKAVEDVTRNDYVYGGLACGDTLYFRIRSYMQEGEDLIYSEWSNAASAQTTPDAPAALTATATSSTAAELTWSAVSGVTGYLLTRDGARIARLTSDARKYSNGGLIAGQTYLYAVYSYKTINGVNVISADCATLRYEAAPPAPKTVEAASAGINTIRLTWSAVAGATAYEVWRTTNYGADFSLRAATDANVYALSDSKNIVSGAKYSYYVITVSNGVKSLPSQIVSASARPAAPGGVKAKYASSTAIRVSWNAVEDVTGYIVESSPSKDGPYTEWYHGANPYYVDSDLSVGDGYYYRVYAYVGSYDNAIMSLPSLIVYEKTRPVRPAALSLQNALYNRIAVSFAHSEGAEGYEIYRSPNGKDFSLLKTLPTDGADETISYANTGLACGATYWYKARAYVTTTIGSVTTKYYSAFSEVKSLRAVPSAPGNVQTSLDSSASKLVVTWSPVTGASGYIVSLKTNGAASVEIGSTVGNGATSFTTQSLVPGNAYAAVIRPYRMVNGVRVVGNYAVGSRTAMPIPVPRNLARYADTLTSMRLAWTAIPGVTGYQVSVTGIDDPSYDLTRDVSSNGLIVPSLTKGFLYACKVRAFSTVKGETTYGDWCEAISVSAVAPKPTSVTTRALTSVYGGRIVWSAVEGADGYVVRRSITKDGGYATIAWLEGADVTSYNDKMTEEEAGNTFYYRVAAYVDVMGNKRVGAFTAYRAVKILPPSPVAKAVTVSPSKISLSWEVVEGADGYYVYRSSAEKGPYSMAQNVPASNPAKVMFRNLETGRSYYFKVKAYTTAGSIHTVSASSAVVSAYTAPVAPTALKATAYAKSVKLTWNKPSSSSGFYVYREQNGSFVYVGQTAAASYTVAGLSSGKEYRFAVAAYLDRSGRRGVGSLSAAVAVTTKVPVPTGLKAASVNNSTLDLKWTAAADCSGYEIAMATDIGGVYQSLGSASLANFRVRNLPLAAMRYFKIRAYSYSGNARVYGAWTAAIGGRTIPIAPAKLRGGEIGRTSVGLQWTPTVGATGYRIGYRIAGTSRYLVAAVIEGDALSEYRITGLKANTQYDVLVRSLCRDDDGALVSGASARIALKTAK